MNVTDGLRAEAAIWQERAGQMTVIAAGRPGRQLPPGAFAVIGGPAGLSTTYEAMHGRVDGLVRETAAGFAATAGALQRNVAEGSRATS